MEKTTKKIIVKISVSLLVIIGLLIGIYFIFRHFGITKLSKEQLQEYINNTGVVAPLLFIAVSFLQVTFVPIPSTVTILAGSYLFGAGISFLYSLIGIMTGSLLAFGLGKWVGRKYVNWIVGSKEKVDEWLEKFKGRSNVLLFFMFLLPGFPDDLLCSIAGITTLGWLGFTAMQIVCRSVAIGATLLFMSGEVIPYHGWGIPVLVTLGILVLIGFILCFKYADKINAAVCKLSERITKRK